MKRVMTNVDSDDETTCSQLRRPREVTFNPLKTSPPPPPPTEEGEDVTGIIDWKRVREEKALNYVLEQRGLGSLKEMADTESYGETDESEDTLTAEAAQKGLEKTLQTWKEQYVQSVHIPAHLETKCSQFITDLTNSSLTIKDVEDGIGTSYTSVQIDSGALTLDWDELFEKEATRQQALTACLVYASIFIPGDGRQVLQDILGPEYIEACKCAGHSCGMDGIDKWTAQNYKTECAEGGNTILRDEGSTVLQGNSGLVDAAGETGKCNLRKRLWDKSQVSRQDGQVLHGRENNSKSNICRKNAITYDRNVDIILLLCENSAFSESEAMEMLARSPEGIEFICSKQCQERIKNYIHISRILVFSEPIKQRFERAKAKFQKTHLEMMTDEFQDYSYKTLINILKNNDINIEYFAKITIMHLQGKTGKKNNLFFFGVPSTGKTMIMSSLVECQFNFCRLTGLTPNSSFNFSNLLHSNACFMDECKLTENQFEQWKLLASGMPMSTDVKYKDRCDIKKCILYTCSNYPIEMYCKVPSAREAINERTNTITFKRQLEEYTTISPFCWEKLWKTYNFEL